MNDIAKIVAFNIKSRRRALKMTQKELAERLNYSEKAISKWENGLGLPPSVTLPALARALSTDIDSLMNNPSDIRYYLGIDGGGTKTEFVLSDVDGNIIKRTVLSGCNPNDIGFQGMFDVLREGIFAVCGEIPFRYISVFAGLAGGITGDNSRRISEFLEQYHFGKTQNGSDAQNAVAISLLGDDGITVIMGTGAIAFAQCGGELHRIGGFGYMFGDEGSGFCIGRDGIQAALQSEDGSGPKTMLEKTVRQKCGKKIILDAIGDYYQGGKRLIASYAPLVFDAYLQGDEVAKIILHRNIKAISCLIIGAAKHLREREGIKVALCGGLMRDKDIIIPILEEYLRNDPPNTYKITVCDRPISHGALILAGMDCDVNI